MMKFINERWNEITSPLAYDPTDTLPWLLDLVARTGIVLMAVATPVVLAIGVLSVLGVLSR